MASLKSTWAASGVAISDFRTACERVSERAHTQLLTTLSHAKRVFIEQTAALTRARAEFDEQGDRLRRCRARVRELEEELKRAQEVQGPAAERLMRVDALNQEIHEANEAVEAQKAVVRASEHAMNHAEHEVIEAEVQLSRMKDALAAAEAAESARAQARTQIAGARAAREESLGRTLARAESDAAAEAAETRRAEANRAAVAVEIARLERSAAVPLDHASLQEQLVDAAGDYYRTKAIGRVDAVVGLKESLQRVENELAGANAKRKSAREAKEAHQRAEAQELLADGQNPYEVFRARDRDAAIAKATQKHAAAVATAKAALTKAVIAEEEKKRELDASAAHAAAAEDEYRKALSRPVRDAKTTAFVMSKTIGHTDVLDPSGRQYRVEPSTATLVKPAGFGLGTTWRSRPDVLESIASKPENVDVAPLRVMVPKAIQDSEAIESGMASMQEDEADVLEVATGSPRDVGGLADAALSSTSSKQRTRTVYELKMLAGARQRQRDGIVQQQVVGGKVYKGLGFLPQPEVLHFKDFVVGQPMQMELKLTNISLSFNSFRLLPIEDAFRDLFTLDFKPPGRMSAGVTVRITVTFLPRVNTDIDTSLTVLAHTGYINVPIRCSTRKAVPRVSTQSLDFGDVTLGEHATQSWVVHNDGALSFRLRVLEINAADEAARDEGASQQPVDDVWRVPGEVEVAPYSDVRIPVRFTPARVGPYLHRALVACTGSGDVPILANQFELMLGGHGAAVPLYSPSPVIDFDICIDDKLYRGTLVIRNRGNVAMKCSAKLPPALDGILEVVPDTGYVQARHARTGEDGEFAFAVKFRPTADLRMQTDRFRGFTSALDSRSEVKLIEFNVDAHVEAHDQVLPVPFRVHARLSPGELQLEPSELVFDDCVVGQAVTRSVIVRNISAAPQQFALLSPPPCFAVAPELGQGFGILLPGEAQTLNVCFTPASAMDYTDALTCCTTLNAEYALRVRGRGVQPLVSLSHAALVLAATAVGETETAAISIRNSSSKDVVFQCLPAAVSRNGAATSTRVRPELLRAAPSVGRIAPGDVAKLHMTVAPTATDLQNDALGELDASGTRHCSWYLPIVVAPCASDAPSTGLRGVDKAAMTLVGVSVQAALAPKVLSVESAVVAFGQVPVGQTASRTVRVLNSGKVPVRVFASIPTADAAFSVMSPPRLLEPMSYEDIAVTFAPAAHRHYAQTLFLAGDGHTPRVAVMLTGEGVSPAVTLEPADADTIDFGAVLVGDVATRQFKIRNASAFPVSVSLRRTDDPAAFEEPTALPTFTCEPAAATLPTGGSVTVTAVFCPRVAPRAGRPMTARFLVHVPNQDTHAINYVALTGRAYAEPFFVVPQVQVQQQHIAAECVGDSVLVTSSAVPPAPTLVPGSSPRPAPPATVTRSTSVADAQDGEGDVLELVFDTPVAVDAGDTRDAPPSGQRGRSAPSADRPKGTTGPGPASTSHEVSIVSIARDASNVNWDAIFSAPPVAALAGAVTSGVAPPPKSGGQTAAKTGATAASSAAPKAGAAGAAALSVPCSFQVTLTSPGPPPADSPAPADAAKAPAPKSAAVAAAGTSQLFSVDVPSGTVPPGGKQVLAFRFTPPSAVTTGARALPAGQQTEAAPRDIVQPGAWATVEAKLTLSSAVPPSSSSVPAAVSQVTKTIVFRLRGFVPSVV